MLTATVLLALVAGLAYANGANDVSKGIATLVGSGLARYRLAVLWGALWTIAGGVLAGLLATELVRTFSGQALLVSPPSGHGFAVAVSCGAVGWLALATATGLPVSTTHALLGGLAGAALAADGPSGLLWGAVAKKAALPLAVSPFLSLLLITLLLPLIRFRGTRLRMGNRLHWLSAGLTSMARGLNDTPKVLALGVAAAPVAGVSQPSLYVLTAVAMAVGGYCSGARVTATLAQKVTPMNPADGLAANLVTSMLVASASGLALPVSTTHVSSSAIIGLGLHGRDARWRTVRDIGLAWLVTIPVAAALAWGAFSLIP